MTGRTHDLTAFTALVLTMVLQPIPQMSFATAIVAFGSNILGGLTPDIDEPTSKFWSNIPAGSIIGRIIRPLLGSHRMITHSIVGMLLIGYLTNILLININTILIVDINIVWWAFMIGYFSHLIADSFTKEGIPLFFPFSYHFGIPPFRAFRIVSGGYFEKALVFPGLLILNCYLFYNNYEKFLDFFKVLVNK